MSFFNLSKKTSKSKENLRVPISKTIYHQIIQSHLYYYISNTYQIS